MKRVKVDDTSPKVSRSQCESNIQYYTSACCVEESTMYALVIAQPLSNQI